MPHPFRIETDPALVARLLDRVRTAHFPKLSSGAGWKYGVDEAWFADLVRYWGSTYKWDEAERRLNRYAQYRAEIDGRQLHFVRLEPSSGATARRWPALLLHGWPYTFATMLPLGERLSQAGFEVIVPSLPGTAFSEAPSGEVRGLREVARRIGLLMTRTLGHEKYVLHGGDHGAVVGDWLTIDFPDNVVGSHGNMVAFRHAGAEYGSGKTGVADPQPEETAYAKAEVENIERESGYFKLQSTRPETIAYALADSPIGWAAYMLDKWQKWTDARARPFEDIYDRDRLLTEVMLYLVTDSVATAIWPYAGFALEPFSLKPGQTISIPTGFSWFPDPLLPKMPRRFVERSRTNIKLWKDHDSGGHFPMLEQTDQLAADFVEFAGAI